MEGIRRARAVLRGIGERIDDLQLLDRRARPPVRDDERQRVLVLGANVDEVDVDPVDLGDEVRQGRKALLELAPVVIRRPIAGQRLDRLELHALRGIRLPVGPPRRGDAAAQVGELLFRDVDVNGRISAGVSTLLAHDDLRCWWGGFEKRQRQEIGLILHETDPGAVLACPPPAGAVSEQPLRSRLRFLVTRICSHYCCPQRMNSGETRRSGVIHR